MNRRAFLGALLGVGAAAATEAVAPSLVWPFRKYFLPSNWRRWWIGYDWAGNLTAGENPFGMITPGSVIETQGFTHVDRNGIWQVSDDGTQNIIWDKPIPDLRYSLAEEYVEAIELEAFAKDIPDLLQKNNTYYNLFKKSALRLGAKSPMPMRVPVRPMSLDGIPVFDDRENLMTMHGIARAPSSKYPGRLSVPNPPEKRGLLHKKATVENIVRFVDDLQSKS